MKHLCPHYEECPHKLGDEPDLECRSEGFIKVEDGLLCLAWDIVLEVKE